MALFRHECESLCVTGNICFPAVCEIIAKRGASNNAVMPFDVSPLVLNLMLISLVGWVWVLFNHLMI